MVMPARPTAHLVAAHTDRLFALLDRGFGGAVHPTDAHQCLWRGIHRGHGTDRSCVHQWTQSGAGSTRPLGRAVRRAPQRRARRQSRPPAGLPWKGRRRGSGLPPSAGIVLALFRGIMTAQLIMRLTLASRHPRFEPKDDTRLAAGLSVKGRCLC